MKRTILLTSLFSLLLILSGCGKSVITPNADRLDGTWYITESERSTGYGWQYFNSGLEMGVFDFYRDGRASFEDGNIRLQGHWRVNSAMGDHYDEDGRLRNGRHHNWRVSVSNGFSGTSIEMAFDNVVVYPNTIIATHFDGYYVIRYVFSRL